MPQLSIIVPIYNKAKYIDACIQTILHQTFTDFELILINDGSTDNSAEKCKYYQNIDNRIVFLDQKNAGASMARNAGLELAKGNFIGFIDSDDTIEPDMYEILVNNLLANDADISVCRMQVIFPDKSVIPQESKEIVVMNHEEALSACLKGDLDRSANNKIYKAEIAKNILFEGIIYEDILYICKAFIKSQKTVLQNALKYNYVVRDNSISMSRFNPQYIQTIEVSAKIKELVAKSDPKCLPEAHAFDVTANISLLNLLLLAGKENYSNDYDTVTATLKKLSPFIKKSNLVRKKHLYAYQLFSASPKLYTSMMQLYCKLTNSEVVKRA